MTNQYELFSENERVAMMDEEFAKNLEKAVEKELKMPLKVPSTNNGPTRPSHITLSVEIDQMIEGLNERVRSIEVFIRALEAFKATL